VNSVAGIEIYRTAIQSSDDYIALVIDAHA
jgi:hypothetical protein